MLTLLTGVVCGLSGLYWGRKAAPMDAQLVVKNGEDHSLLKNAHVQRLSLLGRQAASAAHEMRGVLSVLYCLAEELEADNAEREAVESLREATRSLHRLSDDMTGFSRVDSGTPHCRIDKALGKALRMSKAELQTTVEVEQWVIGLPSVAMDEGRLVQVFVNLLKNSADAIRESGGGRVRVSGQIDSGQVLLLVEDDGPGIEPAVAARVFEPFVTTKTSSDGTGLGLAVSRSLAREVGGEIGLAPGVLGGACFAIRLPMQELEMESYALAS